MTTVVVKRDFLESFVDRLPSPLKSYVSRTTYTRGWITNEESRELVAWTEYSDYDDNYCLFVVSDEVGVLLLPLIRDLEEDLGGIVEIRVRRPSSTYADICSVKHSAAHSIVSEKSSFWSCKTTTVKTCSICNRTWTTTYSTD